LVTAGFIAGRSVSNAAQLRDLAAAASRLFGWDTKQPQTQINQLCISTEQLQQIRALREQADAQERSTAATQRRENK
jgi:hypothetical protein